MKFNPGKAKSSKLYASHARAVHSCFSEIYLLIRQQQYEAALNLLCGKKCERINKVYKIDPNHAWYGAGTIFFHPPR